MLVDPRRWGALIGVPVGWCSSSALGPAVAIGATVVGGLASAIVFAHYVRPTSLGSRRAPSRKALLVYAGCVVGELAVIAVGSLWLTSSGHVDLGPALIADVVGVPFLPFAWAFGEWMFRLPGLALLGLGGVSLMAGFAWHRSRGRGSGSHLGSGHARAPHAPRPRPVR